MKILFVAALVAFLTSPLWSLEWQKVVVDVQGDVGQYASLALDSKGYPHLSCYDATSDALRYMHWSGSGWVGGEVAGGGGTWTSIALDQQGVPHISFISHQGLRLAHGPYPGWTVTTVDPTADPGPTSLAMDGDGDWHVVYCEENECTVWYLAEGENPQIVGGGLMNFGGPSLALKRGLGDSVSVTYYYHPSLLSRSKNSGVWVSPQEIDRIWGGESPACAKKDQMNRISLAIASSLAFDTLSLSWRPSVAYLDARRQLKYASYNGTTWDTTQAASDTCATTVSLAIDGRGNPHVAYYDVNAAQLKYSTKIGSVWQTEVVDAGPGLDIGQYPSLKLDGNDLPWIAYYDATKGDLKLARGVP